MKLFEVWQDAEKSLKHRRMEDGASLIWPVIV
jgi:hypothetical protein